MDQIKIGKFIAECRKKENLTQVQLAEKLGITDRAVSKWENGRSMPDASNMLDLCSILKISVNDLLCGEVVSMEKYNERTEKNLIEMIRQKEEADKRLLSIEVFIAITSIVILLVLLATGIYVNINDSIRFLLIGVGFVQFVISMLFAIRIEQVAGYYECAKCGHKYVPTFISVNKAMHMGRKRYMKCPECGKKSWQKKVLSKE
ncbi:helix-turn-helix transcriptional regulator [uncultured Ruminococcus sp.]|uniref:helix-turn-helix transcriptional regulator n=1 Tax=uncultured Ruminococcus sp. TaxID=165186 RepID=UPI002611A63B|nr:helix-turn-helix transcriptional regulator [uncultured Ruminococcus sp.]